MNDFKSMLFSLADTHINFSIERSDNDNIIMLELNDYYVQLIYKQGKLCNCTVGEKE